MVTQFAQQLFTKHGPVIKKEELLVSVSGSLLSCSQAAAVALREETIRQQKIS